MAERARLLTMAPSHYSEKARWSLDLAGIPYREECLAPGLHLRALKKAGGKSCPTLIFKNGPLLKDSTDILKYVDQHHPQLRLWPQEPTLRAEVDRLEDALDEELAPRVRNWMYSWGIADRKLVVAIFSRRLPLLHRAFLFGVSGQLGSLIGRKFKLRRKTQAEHLALLQEQWTQLDARLSDGRKFLVGDHFTAADLALAAIGAHIVDPPEFGGATAPLRLRPDGVRQQCEAMRASPTGQLILRLYREERLPRIDSPIRAA